MRLILSTSNIMGGGPSLIHRGFSRSNTELTTSLRNNFTTQRDASGPEGGSEPGSWRSWTNQKNDRLYIPALGSSSSGGLAEERSQYDITVKLFFLPNMIADKRQEHIKEALDLVLKELSVPSIDLLIVSFPGIVFDADDESEDEVSAEDNSPSAASDPQSGGVEDIESMIRAWQTLEELHDQGLILKLGVSEFGSARLQRFLEKTRIKPTVDQINVRDCCVVPKPLIIFAKQEGIELLTHNDCTNILPKGTLREILGPPEKGVGLLTAPGEGMIDGQEALAGNVEPQWVVKYTAVVQDRGVVENKGYFACAELDQS